MALNPLIKVTATKAKMEAVIRNTTIESPCMGWITPCKPIVIAAVT